MSAEIVSFADYFHEQEIERAKAEFLAASPADRRGKWDRFRELILSRSSEQVRQMEMEKGLR